MQKFDLNECSKSDGKWILVVTLLMVMIGCGGRGNKGSSSQKTDTGKVVTYTTVEAAFNVSTNDYRIVTAMKTVYDTVMSVVVEDSGGKEVREKKKVRDSSYMVWHLLPVPDSTGKRAMKNKTGVDSMAYMFVPIQKELIIGDKNKNWPVHNQ